MGRKFPKEKSTVGRLAPEPNACGDCVRPKRQRSSKQEAHRVSRLLVLLLLAGCAIIAYPYIARFVNSLVTDKQIEAYTRLVTDPDMSKEDKQKALQESGRGTLGVLKIKEAGVSALLFSGTSRRELAAGAGHVDTTSLPTKEPGTNCMFAGHSGLSYIQIFDGLHNVKEGMRIEIITLDGAYEYRVTDVVVTTPQEAPEYERAQADQTLLTLITCTPIGINSHRLIVRGTLDNYHSQ